MSVRSNGNGCLRSALGTAPSRFHIPPTSSPQVVKRVSQPATFVRQPRAGGAPVPNPTLPTCATTAPDVSKAAAHRPRVRRDDARQVRQQVESAAASLRLRGARKYVLDAVLSLLCDKWSRLTDDRMKLRHIMLEIERQIDYRYDLKTLGRALASLSADNLLTYQPALGRGNNAVVAIHSRFTAGIETLRRDARGKVILGSDDADSVTFSRRRYSPIGISKNLSTAPDETTASKPARPTEVRVNSDELHAVMDALPPVLATMPRHLKWLLRCEVRSQLARGYLPQQIAAVLAAPMPDTVNRPYRLAMYRFAKNSIGAGLRLTRAQQAWDRRQSASEAAALEESTDRWLAAVTDASDPQLRADLIEAFLTCNKRSVLINRNAMLVQAARRAQREHPSMPLPAAMRHWVTEVLGQRAPIAVSAPAAPTSLVDELLHAVPAGTCIACRVAAGTVRSELPLPTPICDDCWTEFAEPDLLEEK